MRMIQDNGECRCLSFVLQYWGEPAHSRAGSSLVPRWFLARCGRARAPSKHRQPENGCHASFSGTSAAQVQPSGVRATACREGRFSSVLRTGRLLPYLGAQGSRCGRNVKSLDAA